MFFPFKKKKEKKKAVFSCTEIVVIGDICVRIKTSLILQTQYNLRKNIVSKMKIKKKKSALENLSFHNIVNQLYPNKN